MDTADNDDLTALIWACIAGHVETVRLLLDKGANIHAADNEGRTAVSLACLNKHIGVVELLLNRKARVDVVNNHGQTVFRIGVMQTNYFRAFIRRFFKLNRPFKLGRPDIIDNAIACPQIVT